MEKLGVKPKPIKNEDMLHSKNLWYQEGASKSYVKIRPAP
jgi:hypothetical protein